MIKVKHMVLGLQVLTHPHRVTCVSFLAWVCYNPLRTELLPLPSVDHLKLLTPSSHHMAERRRESF